MTVLAAFLEYSPNPTWLADSDGRCIYANHELRKITTLNVARLGDLSWLELVAEQDRQMSSTLWQEDPRTPCANDRTSAPRSQLLYRPAPSTYRSLRQPLNLPEQVHYLLRRMLLPSCHTPLLLFQFYRFSTGTKSRRADQIMMPGYRRKR